MMNNRNVHLRGATVSESERIKATSLELEFKNIWVRSMCFIHTCKEQNIATPLNAIGQPIVPEDFEPSLKLVQKYRKWFKRAMREEMKNFQKKFYGSGPIKYVSKNKNGETIKEWEVEKKSLKLSAGQLNSYMDHFYYDSIKLSKCSNYREWAEHVMEGMSEETIDAYAKACERNRMDIFMNFIKTNPPHSGIE